MAKRGVKLPIVLKGETIILSRKEFALYKLLEESKGEVVLIEKIKQELDCDENYIRLIKKSLQRSLGEKATVLNCYGTGYRLINELENTAR